MIKTKSAIKIRFPCTCNDCDFIAAFYAVEEDAKIESIEHMLNSKYLTNPFGDDNRGNFISIHNKTLKKYQCNFCSGSYTSEGKVISNYHQNYLAQKGYKATDIYESLGILDIVYKTITKTNHN